MNIDIKTWLTVLARASAGVLMTQGKNDQAALLNDAASALNAGKNVDDVMQAYADHWEQVGEPTFDEIAAARQRIQERM